MKATAIIIEKGNKILLSKRSLLLSEEPGKWENVGGSLDEGETFEQAIIRELMEELGVKPIKLEKLLEYKNDKSEIIVTVFRSDIVGIPQILEKDACDELKWVSKKELSSLDLANYTKQDFIKLGWL